MNPVVRYLGGQDLRARAEAVAEGFSTLLPSQAHRDLIDGIEAALRAVCQQDECCVPLPGEPSFVLLGRDPQAPALVETWAAERKRAEPLSHKPVMARRTAGAMVAWKLLNPEIGLPAAAVAFAAPATRDAENAALRRVLAFDTTEFPTMEAEAIRRVETGIRCPVMLLEACEAVAAAGASEVGIDLRP
ncbi:hypothetical protein AX289_17215 [Methylorubrum populi]|nr:hypothetical protein AX289_17215 [Methylorubrum populi]